MEADIRDFEVLSLAENMRTLSVMGHYRYIYDIGDITSLYSTSKTLGEANLMFEDFYQGAHCEKNCFSLDF